MSFDAIVWELPFLLYKYVYPMYLLILMYGKGKDVYNKMNRLYGNYAMYNIAPYILTIIYIIVLSYPYILMNNKGNVNEVLYQKQRDIAYIGYNVMYPLLCIMIANIQYLNDKISVVSWLTIIVCMNLYTVFGNIDKIINMSVT